MVEWEPICETDLRTRIAQAEARMSREESHALALRRRERFDSPQPRLQMLRPRVAEMVIPQRPAVSQPVRRRPQAQMQTQHAAERCARSPGDVNQDERARR